MDDDGQLVGDLPLLDLLLALRTDPEARVGQLLDDEEPVTVGPDARADRGGRAADPVRGATRCWWWRTGDRSAASWPTTSSTRSSPTKGRFHFPQLFE